MNERPIIVYDPCVGYAGTLLGAMAAASDRPIHFIGTEPNSTNYLRSERSRYDVLNELYRGCVGQEYYATFEIFPVGAEVVDEFPAFQRYRGLIDVVLTSPPYFCAEIYSREPTQSSVKFPTYPEWRDGFLRKTLRTCADYLKPGGYLLWNIADISVKGKFLPLEQDSIDAMREYGLEFVDKLKMPLSHEPGGMIDVNGLPKMKNFVVFNSVHHKYEPVFVFRKPDRGLIGSVGGMRAAHKTITSCPRRGPSCVEAAPSLLLPTQKFVVIYADPPWQYSDKGFGKRPDDLTVKGSFAPEAGRYSTMTIAEICALPVREIAASNSALFLWATSPLLPEAEEVMKSWGFKHKAIGFCWSKRTPNGKEVANLGRWTLSNIELCLLGTRGRPRRVVRNVRQLVVAKRTDHSRKPEEVRRRIETLFGDVPRIELFARVTAPGWERWGKEAPIEDGGSVK